MEPCASATGADDTTNIIETVAEAMEAHQDHAISSLEELRQRLVNINNGVDSRISNIHSRIHRFPHTLRGIGGHEERYVVPSVVAIGPYHHGKPHLEEMEAAKHVAAYKLSQASGRSVDVVYDKILSITGDIRGCYDASSSVVGLLSDAELATMMFLDGCFLLWYMADSDNDALLRGCNISSGPSILKDIFMLENQIPWQVLEVLMIFWPMNVSYMVFEQVAAFFFHVRKKMAVPSLIRLLQPHAVVLKRCCYGYCRGGDKTNDDDDDDAYTPSTVITYKDFKPPHLLGLMRYILIHGMPPQSRLVDDRGERAPSVISSSAVDLAQIGVEVVASEAKWFADMKVHKKLIFFGELSLSPMFMNDIVACYLVNLAALEAAQASAALSYVDDGYVISSYLSVLAMLMDNEGDVHELRKRGVLSSHFSNAQTLAFFKDLGQHLRLGNNYYCTVKEIEDYMQQRPLRTRVYKSIYNKKKIIITIISIVGVLVGIFKGLYSIKQT